MGSGKMEGRYLCTECWECWSKIRRCQQVLLSDMFVFCVFFPSPICFTLMVFTLLLSCHIAFTMLKHQLNAGLTE